MVDRFMRSIPSPMGVIGRTRGVREIGMAISYSSWIAHELDFGPQKHEGAVLALIAACMVTTEGDRFDAGSLHRLADVLDTLAAAATQSRNARAIGGIRKQDPDPAEATESVLHHALMDLSRTVAAAPEMPGYAALGDIVEAVARAPGSVCPRR